MVAMRAAGAPMPTNSVPWPVLRAPAPKFIDIIRMLQLAPSRPQAADRSRIWYPSPSAKARRQDKKE